MLTLRVMTAAFLENGDDFLMMKRSLNMKLMPGLWAAPGGHLDPEEINDPRRACLRELNEETGLTEQYLSDFQLRYIIIRLKGTDEIRIQYIFFGQSVKREVTANEEGELYWINKLTLSDLQMPTTIRLTLEHYFQTAQTNDTIYTGTVKAVDGKPVIQWAQLQDWEV
jgi:8-oxo-dGTP diphosphatase